MSRVLSKDFSPHDEPIGSPSESRKPPGSDWSEKTDPSDLTPKEREGERERGRKQPESRGDPALRLRRGRAEKRPRGRGGAAGGGGAARGVREVRQHEKEASLEAQGCLAATVSTAAVTW